MMMRQIARSALAAPLAAFTALAALPALAQDAKQITGKPVDLGVNLQRPVTEHYADLVWLDTMILVIITAIVIFVTALIGYTVWRYSEKKNPTPQTFTHNATVEVIWTAIPVLILVVIAIPSLRLLDKQMTVPEPELTIKAIGNQWYWDYQYPDEGIEMSAFMLGKDELEENGYQPDEYLLATDTRVVVPADTNVQLLVTAADVIHNWAMPAFGIKMDGIPGRINETWFNVAEEGTYFGQCSELCGMNHAYMPIVVEVVSKAEYAAWVEEQIAKRDGATRIADASAATE